MSEFQVKISGVWTTPPNDAKPVGIGSSRIDLAPIVRRNAPSARSGLGYPVGIDDELWAEVGRPRINATGLAWWYTTVGLAGNDYISAEVRLFDPEDQTWHTYSGYMWRPVYTGVGMAGTRLVDFRVRITNLTQTS